MLPARRSESGYTVVELAIAAPVALIVLFVALASIGNAERSERSSRMRQAALQGERVGLERMTRELRQATSFRFLTSQVVEFDTFVRTTGTGVPRRVRYDCSSGTRCVRQEGPPGGVVTAAKVPIIEALENPDVFEPEPDFASPRYVGIVARVRFGEDRPLITLRDGVDLRNLTSRF